MAHKIQQLAASIGPTENILVILGQASMLYGHGVPAAVWKVQPDLKNYTYLLGSRLTDHVITLKKADYRNELKALYGNKGAPPADLCFVCQRTNKQPKQEEEASPKNEALMVYVTCPDDKTATQTARKIIKAKLCRSINVYPAADQTYWDKIRKKSGPISKLINICGKTSTSLERMVSARGEPGDKGKTEAANREVLVVVKTDMACY
jgi:hypothetical protein